MPNDENDDQGFVAKGRDYINVPKWAALVFFGGLVAIMGGGLNMWYNFSALDINVRLLREDFVDFRRPGARCTANDCKRIEDKVDTIGASHWSHIAECGSIRNSFDGLEHRLDILENHILKNKSHEHK